MRSMNSSPEANAFESIPRERTSRFMARQTDSSSSTMAISGLDLLQARVLLSQAQQQTEDLRRSKATRPIRLSMSKGEQWVFQQPATGSILEQFKEPVY